ncbi:MAG: RHS repeat-associated core domain-containing protein [Saprospiraceae bacterium]|nr:RHS repeat-associated core domain-containing protein [Saprospiraceae bacterium]
MEEQFALSPILWKTPYLFNGKELDSRTNLYYYGARYYDPGLSVWLSVDPLAEKYAAWTPYNFTMQNPIVLMDIKGDSISPSLSVPIRGILDAFSHTGDLLSTAYNHSKAVFAKYLPGQEGEVTRFNGTEWHGTDVKAFENRKNERAEDGPNIDLILAGFGAVKATANPVKTVLNAVQYASDALTTVVPAVSSVSDEIRKKPKSDTLIMEFQPAVGNNRSKVDTVYNTRKVE